MRLFFVSVQALQLRLERIAGISFAESQSERSQTKDTSAARLSFFVFFRLLMRKRNGYVRKQKNQAYSAWPFIISTRSGN